ncbi:putative MFS-type transporter-like protein [Hapsidospora chrysogenum ATCC 11550]|uniref:Putative MFS-type transporter-like protein n=1 Tax=Hapsidospora chrysogenum (strain ATCC 11550 / CBS 779.69 / DSM 880 / IAM 14645 / JCM 23072 / IMI 49137) TaxID=857340 RepID=A0A086STT9_HAPC1|nr:putative MFS-type transporter-like protein [Hapsidospora chrysogenum ATCC 11550]
MTASSMSDQSNASTRVMDETLDQPRPRPTSHISLLFDHSRIDDAVLNYTYPGKGTQEHPYVVSWIPEDAGNPYNWSKGAKWTITMISALTCFAVAFSSSAYTGTMMELMMYFRSSSTLITAGVSLYVLGFALGPLIWAPLSEIYGRQLIFAISYGLYAVFSAACTADDGVATLLILRFFAGTFGSSPLTNAGGVVSDVFRPDERSIAMGVFSLAPSMGPTLGPFIGGYLGQYEGWRWVMGLMGILAGVCWILGLILVPETYAPLILKKRAQALSAKTGRVYISEYEQQGKVESPTVILKKALSRPLQLLFVEPIVLILSIYTAIVYGTLYMLFGAYPVVFQLERGWSPGEGGLAFLGIAVGMILALPVVSVMNLRYMKVAQRSADGVAPPEARLAGSMLGGILVPAGMFWFAWTSFTSIHWMVPISSGVFFGLGMTLIFHSIFNYLIDAYTIYAASVLAANAVLRSLFGAAFPLFTRQMYEDLGTQWASTVPAFLALACLPMPFVLYKYGPAIRRKCKYSAKAAKAAESATPAAEQA